MSKGFRWPPGWALLQAWTRPGLLPGLPARGPSRCVTRELSPSLPVPHPGGRQEIP